MNWFKRLFTGKPKTIRNCGAGEPKTGKCEKCGTTVLKQSEWPTLRSDDYYVYMDNDPDVPGPLFAKTSRRFLVLGEIVSNAGLICRQCGAIFCASCLGDVQILLGPMRSMRAEAGSIGCPACGKHSCLGNFRGQDPVSTGPESADAFEKALETEDVPSFRQWLHNGMDANRDFKDGFRPLHLIARRYTDQASSGEDTRKHTIFLLSVARLFLEHDADPNARATPVGNTGITPLHLAYTPVAKLLATLLFRFGADATIRDNFGRTPAERQLLDISNLRSNGYAVDRVSDDHVEFLRKGPDNTQETQSTEHGAIAPLLAQTPETQSKSIQADSVSAADKCTTCGRSDVSLSRCMSCNRPYCDDHGRHSGSRFACLECLRRATGEWMAAAEASGSVISRIKRR